MTRFYLIVILGLKRSRKYRPELMTRIMVNILNFSNEILNSFIIFNL
jgi:hypothetical protein